jgi:pimeloyl-ACP methyl ester carboxylesterase
MGDRQVGYEDIGAGAPVVLLHPFPFDRRIWAATTTALAPTHRVLAVDARGFGESPLEGPYSIAALADDLAALLGALDIQKATLCGMSMGGYVALAFAQRHAAMLSRLVLADTRAAADAPAARQGREQALALVRASGPGAYVDQSLPRLLAPNVPAAVLARARELAERRAASLIAGIEALRDRPDRTAELAAIRVPTLVIAGAEDQVVAVDEMRRMSAAIAGSRVVEIAGAGHLPALEAPEPFNRALAEFLREP